MIVNVYAIYDSKVQAFLQPWYAQNHATACRNLELACRDPKSGFVQFPVDYTLFCIGEYDDQSGVISPHQLHQNLGNMQQFLPAAETPQAPSVATSKPTAVAA